MVTCAACERSAGFVEERYFYASNDTAAELVRQVLTLDGALHRAGAPRAAVLERVEGAADLPLVIYSVRLRDDDAAALAARAQTSAEVTAIQRTLEVAGVKSRTILWRVVRDEPPSPGRWVTRNWYFARAGNLPTVLAARREGSDVREAAGLPPGRIFASPSGPDARGGPDVVWETTLVRLDAAVRAREAQVAASPPFVAVLERVRPALARFETSTWTRRGGAAD